MGSLSIGNLAPIRERRHPAHEQPQRRQSGFGCRGAAQPPQDTDRSSAPRFLRIDELRLGLRQRCCDRADGLTTSLHGFERLARDTVADYLLGVFRHPRLHCTDIALRDTSLVAILRI